MQTKTAACLNLLRVYKQAELSAVCGFLPFGCCCCQRRGPVPLIIVLRRAGYAAGQVLSVYNLMIALQGTCMASALNGLFTNLWFCPLGRKKGWGGMFVYVLCVCVCVCVCCMRVIGSKPSITVGVAVALPTLLETTEESGRVHTYSQTVSSRALGGHCCSIAYPQCRMYVDTGGSLNNLPLFQLSQQCMKCHIYFLVLDAPAIICYQMNQDSMQQGLKLEVVLSRPVALFFYTDRWTLCASQCMQMNVFVKRDNVYTNLCIFLLPTMCILDWEPLNCNLFAKQKTKQLYGMRL